MACVCQVRQPSGAHPAPTPLGGSSPPRPSILSPNLSLHRVRGLSRPPGIGSRAPAGQAAGRQQAGPGRPGLDRPGRRAVPQRAPKVGAPESRFIPGKRASSRAKDRPR